MRTHKPPQINRITFTPTQVAAVEEAEHERAQATLGRILDKDSVFKVNLSQLIERQRQGKVPDELAHHIYHRLVGNSLRRHERDWRAREARAA